MRGSENMKECEFCNRDYDYNNFLSCHNFGSYKNIPYLLGIDLIIQDNKICITQNVCGEDVDTFSIKINYCPMCGRKLEGKEVMN
jgi:hypothetical protein